jgi:hypothetical protein
LWGPRVQRGLGYLDPSPTARMVLLLPPSLLVLLHLLLLLVVVERIR